MPIFLHSLVEEVHVYHLLNLPAFLQIIVFGMNGLEEVLSLPHEFIQGLFFLGHLDLFLLFVMLGEISLEALECCIDDGCTVGIVARLRAVTAMEDGVNDMAFVWLEEGLLK